MPVLENSVISLRLDPARATFSCDHKQAGVGWGTDPWQGTLGYAVFESVHGDKESVSLSSARASEVEEGDGFVRIKLSDFKTRLDTIRDDRALGEKLSISLLFELTDDGFSFTVESLDIDSRFWFLYKLCAPLRGFSVKTVVDDGFTVVPSFQGGYIPSRYNKGYFRYLNWVWETISGRNENINQMSMNWFGAAKGESGYVAIVETPFDCELDVVLNNTTDSSKSFNNLNATVNSGGALYSPRLTAVSPVWYASHKSFSYSRKISYHFIKDASITSMSKLYREYAKENGYFRTLEEKIAANPNVKKLLGGPDLKVFMATKHILEPDRAAWSGPVFDGYEDISTTFEQLADMTNELKEAGINSGVMHVGGWTTQGYDNHRPIDTIPPSAGAGGEAGFAAATKAILDAGMIMAVHDNYRNFDLNSPSFYEDVLSVDKYGLPDIGFTSEGGESHQICSACQLELLKKTCAYMTEKIGANGYFLDTTTSTQLAECYSEKHPITKTQDVENKVGLLAWLQAQGLVTGAESGTFWGLAHADFFEGMMGTRVGLPIPLFNLVYHDCVVVYWQHGNPYNYESPRGNFSDHVLSGLIHGNTHNYCVSGYVFPGWKKQIVQLNKLVSDFHKRIATQELVEFTLLSEDMMLQTSKFADGTRVIINNSYQNESVCVDGITSEILYKGFLIRNPDGKEITGQVEHNISFN